MFNYIDTIPEHIEERSFLEDPSVPSFISDISFSLESDLEILDLVCSFENEIPLNAAIQIASRYGMEANSFVETAKKTYFMLKQRATQLIKYICKIFLDFIRGTTDAKAVFKKYETKLLKYSSEFDKLGTKFSDGGSVEIRNPRDRISYTTYMVTTTCHCLESILNLMYSNDVKNRTSIEKLMVFSKAVQLLNFSLAREGSDKLVLESDSLKKFFDDFDNKIDEIADDPKGFKLSTDKVNSNIEDRTKSLKEVFKKDYPKESFSYQEAYDFMVSTHEILLYELFGIAKEKRDDEPRSKDSVAPQSKFKLPEGASVGGVVLTNNLSSKGGSAKFNPKTIRVKKTEHDSSPKAGYVKKKDMEREIDFKKLARKIDVIEKEMIKSLSDLDKAKDSEENNKGEDIKDVMKVIMGSGAQMTKVKDLISLSLSTFKGDMEVVIQETKKVGSLLHQHKQ